MASMIQRLSIPATSRALPSGVPATLINFAAKPLSAGHDNHGVSSGPRADPIPAWSSRVNGRAQVGYLNARPTGVFTPRHFSTSRQVARDTTDVPDFTPYMAKSPSANRTIQYFMVGSMGLLAASGAKSTVTDILSNMAASADVLALAKVEVEMASIPEGKNLIVKWRGKPVFIRHRTAEEIEEANQVDIKTLRDPQTDAERVKDPQWLVMLGVCTHLGCVPIGEAGDYGGWFCPCHGSHYDISGRIRKGPAPVSHIFLSSLKRLTWS